jgi:hypothetical protein
MENYFQTTYFKKLLLRHFTHFEQLIFEQFILEQMIFKQFFYQTFQSCSFYFA